MSIPRNNTKAVLRDDGNLVLSEHDKDVWQSFEDPVDTFVPGMALPVSAGTNIFRSWKSETDPSPGNYSMKVDSEGSTKQILILEGEKRRKWRSGYWDGRVFTGVSDVTGSSLFGFTVITDTKGEEYFTYKWNSPEKVRFQITWDGFEKKFVLDADGKQWNRTQFEPFDDCEKYNFCGSFAVCDTGNSPFCSCMEGFEPMHWEEWNNRNWTRGCGRRTPLKAEAERSANNSSSGADREVSVGEDGFLEQRCTKFPDFARLENFVGDADCQRYCLQNTSCTAYSYTIGIGCMIWYGELVDVQHSQNNLGSLLHIRLADADLGK